MTIAWRYVRQGWRKVHTHLYAAAHGVRMGAGTIIMPGARLMREDGGSIILGNACAIHPGAMLLTYGGDIRIGDHCSVNPYSILYGHGGLTIGDHVRIAAHCVIIPADHGFAAATENISDQPETRRGIHIASDVWLGAGVRVLDGAQIGTGCVVAAGAVVKGTLEPYGIYGGVPARLLRWRSLEHYVYERDAVLVDKHKTSVAAV